MALLDVQRRQALLRIERTHRELQEHGIVPIEGEGSESWNHVWQVVFRSKEELEICAAGLGNEDFRQKAVPHAIDSIRTLAELYTVEELSSFPGMSEVMKLLPRCDSSLGGVSSISELLEAKGEK
jgi:hypothetical protein